jgi:hypothetical protein
LAVFQSSALGSVRGEVELIGWICGKIAQVNVSWKTHVKLFCWVLVIEEKMKAGE